MSFAKITPKCLGCKSSLPDGEAALCHNCKSKEVEVYFGKMQATVEFERLFARLWTQCQRCQGDMHKDVLCTSRDCPIFYKRKKVQKDLSAARETLSRFGDTADAW
jgi:DNA polymerase delta subunit 1